MRELGGLAFTRRLRGLPERLLLLQLLLLFRHGDAASTAASPETQGFRLPTAVKPVHYALTLAPFIYGTDATEFYFTGSVRINITVISSTSNFKLHTKQIAIDSDVKVLDARGTALAVQSVEEDTVRQWQSVTLREALQSGSTYTVVIDRFSGPLRTDLIGMYLSSYTENGAQKYLATSQMEPTDARKAFPCFDEPAFKATFAVSLVRRQDFKAISNMPSKAVANVSAADWFRNASPSDRFVKEDFEVTPVMSTYLTAFLVSQFHSNSATDSRGRRFVSWAEPDKIKYSNYSLQASVKTIEFFEKYLDVPYPLNVTNQAAVPAFKFAAMENWGLVIYGEVAFLYNESSNDPSSKLIVAITVCHELAHQWFGNLVTMTWWDQLWLNEGFATFFSYIALDYLHPDWEADLLFVSYAQLDALKVDSGHASRPVQIDVQLPNEINQMIHQITYKKGGSVARMMFNSLGEAVFRAGVSNYLKNYSYSNTLQTDLYESLTQATGGSIDVAELMHRWIKQMGYPVLNCTRQAAAQLSLSQQHFLSDPSQTPDRRYPSPFNFTWIIPITMVTKDNVTSWNGSAVSHLVHWMREKSQTFSIDTTSSWYLLNLRSTGFYRVNYDTDNWNALISQLLTDHTVFTPHDRARLLDDSFSLASAGYISKNISHALLQYMHQERHYVPWIVARKIHWQSRIGTSNDDILKPMVASAYIYTQTLNEPLSYLNNRLKRIIQGSACQTGIVSC